MKSTPFKSTLLKLLVFIKNVSFVAFSFLLFSCSPEDDGIYFEHSTNEIVLTKTTYSEMESEILRLVNAHRKSINLSKLDLMEAISSEANEHTSYMISEGQASHDNFSQRAQNLITYSNAKAVGENVAYGYTTPHGVVNGWLDSASHRKVIENPNFTYFGVSMKSDSKGKNYFTHIFISK